MQTTLQIDIADYIEKLEEYARDEDIDFSTPQTIIETLLLKRGLNGKEAGMICVAARHRGYIKDVSIWPEHLIVLERGSAVSMQTLIHQEQQERELKNGNTVRFNSVIGRHRRNDHLPDEAQNVSVPFVPACSEEGISRAKDYIMNRVIGHIRSHLAQIAACEGNVKEVAKELKREIDGIVKEYT